LGVEAGDLNDLVRAVCILTGVTGNFVHDLPVLIGNQQLDGLALALHVSRRCLLLDLDCLFPHRNKPTPELQWLFEQSDNVLAIPVPDFICEAVCKRLPSKPQLLVFGDIVNWREVNSRASLVAGETCKLSASLARASKSTGAAALACGLNRLEAAALTLDFSLIGSARMHYSRLTGEGICRAARAYFGCLGWDDFKEMPTICAAGSHVVLTSAGATEIFSHLAQQCNESHPGRRASLSRLLQHHLDYARYVAALLSFCLGLREAQLYCLLASDLVLGQLLVVPRDKDAGDPFRALPVPLNRIVREQIRLWFAHCAGLAKRLEAFDDPSGQALARALRKVAAGAQVPLLVIQGKAGHSSPTGGRPPSPFG
jgi:hypothetical protein